MPTQNDCHTISDLYQMQSLPLEIKVRMTQRRIRDWVEYWGEDGVYVSFSGGKDSTVLLDISSPCTAIRAWSSRRSANS